MTVFYSLLRPAYVSPPDVLPSRRATDIYEIGAKTDTFIPRLGGLEPGWYRAETSNWAKMPRPGFSALRVALGHWFFPELAEELPRSAARTRRLALDAVWFSVRLSIRWKEVSARPFAELVCMSMADGAFGPEVVRRLASAFDAHAVGAADAFGRFAKAHPETATADRLQWHYAALRVVFHAAAHGDGAVVFYDRGEEDA